MTLWPLQSSDFQFLKLRGKDVHYIKLCRNSQKTVNNIYYKHMKVYIYKIIV